MRVKPSKIPMIIGIGIVAIIILTIIVEKTNDRKKSDYSKMTDEEIEEVITEKINDINQSELADLGERERMERYVSSFITAIENKEYETAYLMLNEDFRKNYFPNISDFENYAKTKFPSMISLQHTNFERNGDLYVMWVTLANPLVGKDSDIELNFVVKENGLNDFELSFSVF